MGEATWRKNVVGGGYRIVAADVVAAEASRRWRGDSGFALLTAPLPSGGRSFGSGCYGHGGRDGRGEIVNARWREAALAGPGRSGRRMAIRAGGPEVVAVRADVAGNSVVALQSAHCGIDTWTDVLTVDYTQNSKLGFWILSINTRCV